MIDIHAHILTAIDDGARNKEEAMELTKALIKENVEAVVCTPHFYPDRISLQDFIMHRNKALVELAPINIRLIPASEAFLHEYLFHYSDLTALCIGETDYLLLELPFYSKWNDRIYTMIDNLISYYNVIPIIAHIERYPAARRNTGCIKKLKAYGCLLQANTSSLLDSKLKKRVINYIKKGYIDLLGSDCHNLTSRPPVILNALKEIERKLGKEYCCKLEQNAIKVINNLDIRN